MSKDLKVFSYKDLEIFTDNFSEVNYIYHAQYCKLYRGKLTEGSDVTVKVWVEKMFKDENEFSRHSCGKSREDYEYILRSWHLCSKKCDDSERVRLSWVQNAKDFEDEINLLCYHNNAVHPSPYLPRLIGFCREDADRHFGAVYDLKSLDVLEYLFDKERFKWHQRMRVAFGLAKLIEELHCTQPRYLIRDLCTANIMLDQEFNPILFNFLALTGGRVLTGKKVNMSLWERQSFGSIRYYDEALFYGSKWSESADVYAFGNILLELMRKVTVLWAGWLGIDRDNYESLSNLKCIYKDRKSKFPSGASLVDETFEIEEEFHVKDACRATALAIQCVQLPARKRPNAREIVEKLKKLNIVKKNEIIGHESVGV